MTRHPVQLLITDLDNTLYDWVSYFVPALYDMVEVVSATLGVPREHLLAELRAIHQHYGSTEHPFALLEAPSVTTRFPKATLLQIKEHLRPALEVFKQRRAQNLQLYPTVEETLRQIRSQGTPILAYTEAAVYNVAHRMRVLDLWAYVEGLYAPEGRSDLALEFGFTDPLERIHLLPPGHRKPDGEVLQTICQEAKVKPIDALYVGDSITRDVTMGRQAGLQVAWAKYGTIHSQDEWDKLVRVTHWTAADVEQEARLRIQHADVQPDCSLNQFKDLTEHFEFVPLSDPHAAPKSGSRGRSSAVPRN